MPEKGIIVSECDDELMAIEISISILVVCEINTVSDGFQFVVAKTTSLVQFAIGDVVE